MANIKAGFGRVCINPPMGTPIIGYFMKRRTKGILDDIYTSAVAISDGETNALVISAETLELSTEQCIMYRGAISEKTGVHPDAIFINCSHTHTGAQPGSVSALGTGTSCPEYEVQLGDAMIAASEMALADLSPAKLSYGEGKAENISFIRRYRMKDGGVQTNPGVNNSNIDHPLGTPNDKVQLLKLEREGRDDIYVVCFGTHADTVGGELISADWPGFVRSTVEGAVPGVKCLFLTGSQGDVNHINTAPTDNDRVGLDYDSFDGVPRGYEHAKHMGRVVAGAVLGICGKTLPVKENDIKFGVKSIDIPAHKENHREKEAMALLELYNNGRQDEIPFKAMELTTAVAEANRIVKMVTGPDSFPFVLSAISVGDFALVGIPGELFVEIGRRVERESVFGATFVCCLTNGGDCYFPTESAYDEGGYEARSSKLDRSAENIVVNGIKELFSELK
ncbi:MAG: hypothetical protein IJW48_05520 [Clostridia bacterium]|nr:hypothetical protein [Clostridia bacterium]